MNLKRELIINDVMINNVPQEILLVASELANCLKIQKLHLVGSYARMLVIEKLNIVNPAYTHDKITNMSFWINKNILNEILLKNNKLHKMDDYHYEFHTKSTNKKVKLFITPDEMLSHFYISNISLLLKNNKSDPGFNYAEVIGTPTELSHLKRKILHSIHEINKAIKQDPSYIIYFNKEILKGFKPTKRLIEIATETRIPKDEEHLWLNSLAKILDREVERHGNAYLDDLKKYAIVKQVLESRTQHYTKYSKVPTFFTPRFSCTDTSNPLVQHQLGEDHFLGFNGVKQDTKQAMIWFEKAMNNGYLPAQYYLGICYLYGDGVEKNTPLAFEHFRTAADNGLIPAVTELACLYLTGEGTSLDLDKGLKLMHYAASLGEAYAMKCMAHFYEHGEGLPTNREYAQYYREISQYAYNNWLAHLDCHYPEYKHGM